MSLTRAGSLRLTRVISAVVALAVLTLAAVVGYRSTARFLLLGTAGLGMLLLLQQPGLGLVAVAMLSFTVPFELGTGSYVSVTAPVFLILAVALVSLVDGLHRRSLRLPDSRTVLPLLLFTAAGLISLLAGRAYWDPLVPQAGNLLLVQTGQWAIYALSALTFIVAADLGTRGRWLQIATFVFLAAASIVVAEFYLPILHHIPGWLQYANRSMFWTWLAALAMGQLAFNRRLGPVVRLWLVALLVGAAYAVWFRQSDWISGWLPFSIAVVVVIWFWVWHRNRTAGLVLAVLLVVLTVALYPILYTHGGGDLERRVSLEGRLALYETTIGLVKDHPILGLGPAAYRHYGYTRSLSMGPGRAFYSRIWVSSHNNYLDIYAQMGLVGLGLFIWFLAEVGRLGWRLMSRFDGDFKEGYVNGVLAGLVGTIIAMALADWFLPFVYNVGFDGLRTSVLAWMFLGGLVALENTVDPNTVMVEGNAT